LTYFCGVCSIAPTFSSGRAAGPIILYPIYLLSRKLIGKDQSCFVSQGREGGRMVEKKAPRVTRRDFVKIASAGVVGATVGPFFLFPERALAQQKTLKILQWSHFVPGFDKWFDGVFAKEWGQKHGVNVSVDHIFAREVNARAAAEVSARKGHDLFLFQFPPAAYEKQAIDLTNVYQEVERKHGKAIPLAVRSTFNPKTKKYFAFSDSYVPFPGNYRQDLWQQVGYPNGPDTYDDLRTGAKKIRDRFGNPCGIGLSQDNDTSSAVRAILWSFGASDQDENGRVTINSKETIEALKFMRALYQESETPEVFTWDETSNNRAMLAGKISYTMNGISITRAAEKDNPEMSRKIWLGAALKGPVRRLSPANVANHYVVWDFAENKEGAQQFLIALIDNFGEAFKASEFYNFPCFPSTVPGLQEQLAHDPKANPQEKYEALSNVMDWTTNIGFPGYATEAVYEVVNTFVLNTMFARVARDQMSSAEAVSAAEKEIKRIFDKWK
jgi:multiple sugar transport system substrate-binding protein